MKWSEQEDLLLSNNYQLKKEEILKILPNRTGAAINIRASKLGLKKERNEYIESELDILLEESNLAYYLVGFILADGSIVNNRLTITISIKDKQHLEKVSKIFKTNISYLVSNGYEQIKISCQDKYIIPKVKEKFNILKNKTYNPPNFSNTSFNKNLLMSLFVGFIDGDGSIRKQTGRDDCSLKIQIHSSWLDFLSYFHNLIEKEFNVQTPSPRLNNSGYAVLYITNSIILKNLKKIAVKNSIPLLNRKWDLIDLNKISRQENAKNTRNKIYKLYKNNIKQKDIAKQLNILPSTVSKTISNFRKAGAV